VRERGEGRECGGGGGKHFLTTFIPTIIQELPPISAGDFDNVSFGPNTRVKPCEIFIQPRSDGMKPEREREREREREKQ